MPQGRNIVGAGTEYYFRLLMMDGFRYEFPRQQQLQEFLIDDEVTEFVFPADYDAWSIPVKGVRFYEAYLRKKLLVRWDG